jgi:hypothetical protein
VSNQKQNRFISWLYDGALFVGIVGVFLIFVMYGLSLLYPAPEYDDFCGETTVRPAADVTQDQCEAAGGRWKTDELNPRPASPLANGTTTQTGTTAQKTTVDGFCDRDYQCRQEFEAAETTHDRTAFAILAILGLAVASWGFAHGASSILPVSFATAGVFLILISSIRYWSQAEDWLQFGLLLVVLAVFVYAGYQRESDAE